jgi:hypothetical protein
MRPKYSFRWPLAALGWKKSAFLKRLALNKEQ